MSRPAAQRPRIRELRIERGWTQQQLAERLIRRSQDKQVGVTADTISKWERGDKGISARYRSLLAATFGVTVDQLGLPGLARRQGAEHRDDRSLTAMVDQAAELLDQLGDAGRTVRPQVLAALTDEVLSRRSTLAFIDTPAPTPVVPSLDEMEDLAGRYEVAHGRAPAAPLLTAVAAQLRLIADILGTEPPTGTRQRLLRNRLRLAILSGQLSEDTGNPMAARAYYSQATDDAYEVGDHTAVAIAHGYAGRLALANGQATAALRHLDQATTLAVSDPIVTGWLASVEAAACTLAGDEPAAIGARERSDGRQPESGVSVSSSWFRGSARVRTQLDPFADGRAVRASTRRL